MIFDVTQALRADMPLYPGTPPFERAVFRDIAAGDTSTNSKITLGAHLGTHIDAPAHYLPDGAGVESLSTEALIGPCRVLDLRNCAAAIDQTDLEALPFEGITRALFRTATSDWLNAEFRSAFAAFTDAGAAFLVKRGVKLVGLDSPSMDLYKAPGHPAHHVLLGAGVIIVEGLDLGNVEPGDYELLCAPLKIIGGEATPAQVFLRKD